MLATGAPAMARICAPGMYCPTLKLTLRSFASHLGVSNSLTMSGNGEERNCMISEPRGNIVAIYSDGSMDWSVNGSWSGPAE